MTRRNDNGKSDDVVTQIVRAIARREGTDPIELSTPLHDVVDPDALTAVLDSKEFVSVEFTYYGYPVTTFSDGTVLVGDQESGARADVASSGLSTDE